MIRRVVPSVVVFWSIAGCGFEGQAPDLGGGDGTGSRDLDGDGVLDPADNCPALANADQYDEDADLVGDVCDNCPQVANRGQENVKETAVSRAKDAVGDACDPRPAESGDVQAAFYTYRASADFAGWSAAGTQNFAVAEGVLRNTAIGDLALAWRNDLAFGNATVRARVTFKSLPGGSGLHGFSVVGNFYRGAGQLGNGLGCGEIKGSGAPSYHGVRFSDDAYNIQNHGDSALVVGQTAIYSARPSGATSVACEVDTNADGVADAFWTHAASFTPGTGLALAVWDAAVDVTSVIVYTGP